jgi:hypothetical protein
MSELAVLAWRTIAEQFVPKGPSGDEARKIAAEAARKR